MINEKQEFLNIFDRISKDGYEIEIDDMISFLKLNTTEIELYKYTLFYFIQHKDRIQSVLKKLMNDKNVSNSQVKVEKFKIQVESFLKKEEKFSKLNDIFKKSYPMIFNPNFNINQNQKLVEQNKEKNRNKMYEDEVSIKQIPIPSNEPKTLKKEFQGENNVEESIKQTPIPSIDSKEFKNEFQSDKHIIYVEEVSIKETPIPSIESKDNSEAFFSNKRSPVDLVDLEIVSDKHSKPKINFNFNNDIHNIYADHPALKEMKKIDELIEKLKEPNLTNMVSITKVKLNQPGNLDIFSNAGLFTEKFNFEKLDRDYKLKLITIFGKMFYLQTENQKTKIKEKFEKEKVFDEIVDEETSKRIKNNLFLIHEYKEKGGVKKELIIEFLKDRHINEFKNIDNNLEFLQNLMNMVTRKEDIRDLYFIYVLNTIHKFLDEILANKLIFMLYIYLTKCLGHDSELIFDLLIIKLFYGDDDGFSDDVFLKIKYNQLYYKNKNFSAKIEEDSICKEDLDDFILFDKRELEVCKDVEMYLNRFYRTESRPSFILFKNKKEKLGDGRTEKDCINYEFTMNIVELLYNKETYIYKNPEGYINKLIRIEKTLYNNYIDFNRDFTKNPNEYDKDLYSLQRIAYQELTDFFSNFNNRYNNNANMNSCYFYLYPFGSVTQFLGSADSDLDMFLQLEFDRDSIECRNTYLRELGDAFKKAFSKYNQVVTNRLITFTFVSRKLQETKKKELKIDINYFGVATVLNSSLLRVYALCDVRFSILAYNVKKYIKSLSLNHSDEGKNYLNSFCWMLLLLTFLQDVVNPPVLPKILNLSSSKKILIQTSGKIPKPDGKKNFYLKNIKTMYDVLRYSENKEFEINEDFLQSSYYENIYQEFRKNNTPNIMSVAELFLKFIEFITFFFKYDSIFVNCGFKGECFMNKSEFKIPEDKSFNYKGLMKKGSVHIKDPFDHTYNPAQTMECTNALRFTNILKSFYLHILKTGELNY